MRHGGRGEPLSLGRPAPRRRVKGATPEELANSYSVGRATISRLAV